MTTRPAPLPGPASPGSAEPSFARDGLRYIEAPQPFEPDGLPSVYLAGATVDCPDWQSQAVRLLEAAGFEGTVLNPRPSRNAAADPYAAWTPLGWQDRNIRRVDVVLFWNPIGHHHVRNCYEARLVAGQGGVVVGCDPADPVQRAHRVLLLHAVPWLPVADTLAGTVCAALAELEAVPARL
ncbi:hypothetical protein OU787_25385 [Kitasatospora sp. YST-16]|uniref:nucleoside 2-deoxyribosyltransferase domain-containing protein n=1 Tax=Kitasatospora sp. YST-16 TaxID=2998080 RepID=UPI002284EBCB|nr:nucleoside 2-deoxyribosyltransferase domain-containing protein [Kitasatospora sp. YST-16]WAL74530.1 hypothetical protein OU787_25385 [Kitasatospora sp. YST-16]